MKVAIITANTAVYKETEENQSGEIIRRFAEDADLDIMFMRALPLDRTVLSTVMQRMCDAMLTDLILVTGGAACGVEDTTPEASLDIIERNIPGIPEEIRAQLKAMGKPAMEFRGVAGTKNGILIVNLPETPEAVEACLANMLPDLMHMADMIKGEV